MSPRFLRHAPFALVNFLANEPLLQIYGAFNAGIMKLFPSLKTDAKAMTEAIVVVYLRIQNAECRSDSLQKCNRTISFPRENLPDGCEVYMVL